MSKWLVISNVGECDPRSFTMLGVSNARGDAAKIGQFGSGAKHSILICLRAGIDIHITSGKHVIRPFTTEQFINNKIYERVCFAIDGEVEPSSMTLDFGELDWATEVPAMLREFVSNALDAVDQKWSDISVSAEDSIKKEEGLTKVYVQMRSDVKKCYSKIEEIFLHATGKEKEALILHDPRPARIYRKGVYVTESPDSSLFDYNMGEELKIDEARKMEGSNLRYHCANLLFSQYGKNVDAVVNILRTGLIDMREVWEHSFSYWSMTTSVVKKAMEKLFGEDVVVTNSLFFMERAKAKGYRPVFFPTYMMSWYQAAESCCKAVDKVLDTNVCKFQNVEEIDSPLTRKVIQKLLEMGLIKPRLEPKVYKYQGVTEGGQSIRGYTDGKDIYLSHEDTECLSTILEEVLHLYTGCKDYSPDMQNHALQLASALLSEKL